MPIPVFIVIPDDMGSNIKEGSTVPGASAADIQHWIATIKAGADYIYPEAKLAADASDPAAATDSFIPTTAFVRAAINAALAGLNPTSITAFTYNYATRALTIEDSSGAQWSTQLPYADSTFAGMVRCVTSSAYNALPYSDIDAATPALVQAIVAGAIGALTPADNVISFAYNAATRECTITRNSGPLTITLSTATEASSGVAQYAGNTAYPALSGSNSYAATPAFVVAAINAAIAALPADKFLQGLQSYDAATNTMRLLMNDGTTVAVDMVGMLNDAIATATASQADVDAVAPTANTTFISPATLGAALGYTQPAASSPLQNKVLATVREYGLDLLDWKHLKDAMTLDDSTNTDLNGKNFSFTGTGSVGIGTAMPAFRLDVGGTASIAERRIGINGVAIAFMPDQAQFTGSMALGDGLSALVHNNGNEGQNNVVVGPSCGVLMTTGAYNVGLGKGAMRNITAGHQNTMVGYGAGYYIDSGSYNTMVGSGAGATVTSANDARLTYIGTNAGNGAASATSSTYIGYASGGGATGNSNVCVGESSGYHSIIASTVLNGVNSGINSQLSDGVGIGVNASRNANGAQCVSAGHKSLMYSIGNFAIGIGAEAGYKQAGYGTTAVGHQAGSLAVGSYNTIVGYQAGMSVTVAGTPIVVTAVTMAATYTTFTCQTPHGVPAATGRQFQLQATTAPAGLTVGIWYTMMAVNATELRLYATVTNAGTDVTLIPDVSIAYNNATAIGNGAVITASNEIKLGNASVTAVRTAGAFYGTAFNVVSDRRLKTDISSIPDTAAIALSKMLNIVQYTRIADMAARIDEGKRRNARIDADIQQLQIEFAQSAEDADDARHAINHRVKALTSEYVVIDETEVIKTTREFGVIAQEVEKLASAFGIADMLVQHDANGYMTVNTNALLFLMARGFQLRLEKAGI